MSVNVAFTEQGDQPAPGGGLASPQINSLIGRQNVEQATIAVLQEWLDEYLAEVEQQNGLEQGSTPRPPADSSYHGGLDFLTFMQEQMPEVIVACQAAGEAERLGSGDYNQVFELQVAAIVSGQDEDTARLYADLYGAAVMGALLQTKNLGGIADRVRMVEFPRTEFIDPKLRQLAQSVQTLHVAVSQVVNDLAGPPSQPAPGPVPVVTSTNLEIVGVPDTEQVPDAPEEG